MLDPEDIDWIELKREIIEDGVVSWDRDNQVFDFSTYLGSVFSLTPSGKYYMPWACSNVTEEEARQDEEWWEKMEVYGENHGIFFSGGEGDPTDIIATTCYTRDELIEKAIEYQRTKRYRSRIFSFWFMIEENVMKEPCPFHVEAMKKKNEAGDTEPGEAGICKYCIIHVLECKEYTDLKTKAEDGIRAVKNFLEDKDNFSLDWTYTMNEAVKVYNELDEDER
jgi:hypothetical protein